MTNNRTNDLRTIEQVSDRFLRHSNVPRVLGVECSVVRLFIYYSAI